MEAHVPAGPVHELVLWWRNLLPPTSWHMRHQSGFATTSPPPPTSLSEEAQECACVQTRSQRDGKPSLRARVHVTVVAAMVLCEGRQGGHGGTDDPP